ncbi:MAG: right-handed parallel beta-helix repeat-containing protein, partial [Pseudomonadota bacterium]
TLLDLGPAGNIVVNNPNLTVVLSRVQIIGGEIEVTAGHRLEIRRCRFMPLDGANGVSWNNSNPAGTLLVEESRVVGRRKGVASQSQVPFGAIEIKRTVFEDCKFSAVNLPGAGDVILERNWVVGGEDGEVILIDAKDVVGDYEVRLERNWIDGARKGILLQRLAGLEHHVIDNSLRATEQTPLTLLNVEHATLQGTRVWNPVSDLSGIFLTGVLVENSKDVMLEGCVISGTGNHGIEVKTSSEITILDSRITRCNSKGIWSQDTTGLSILGGVVSDTNCGIDVKGGDVVIQDFVSAGNDTYGVRIREAYALEVRDSELVGNGSIGLLASSLQGDDETSYIVSGNRIQENIGVGLLVRSGGFGDVDVDNNTILGTGPGSITNVQGSVIVGDGVAILTGTDGVASRATLGENEVRGNERLGVIAHGEGTVLVSAPQDVVLSLNGWLAPLCLGGGGDPHVCQVEQDAGIVEQPNLILYQAGAVVEGGAKAFEPTALVPVTGLDQLGGGGDPR